MSSKVGIVSLYVGQNFGNKLQNYAVETIVRRCGFDAYTFRYDTDVKEVSIRVPTKKKINPKYILSYVRIKLSRKLPLKNSDSSLFSKVLWLAPEKQKLMKKAKESQIKAYKHFDESYLHFSPVKISADEQSWEWTKEFNFFVCGSDQVWNPYYSTTSKLCFLQFAPRTKRIALAPSFGVSTIPVEYQKKYKKWIQEIPALSVREEDGAKIIKELTGRISQVLVDPTMALTRQEWDLFAEKPEFALPDRYILSYFLGDRTREYQKQIDKLADKLNCKTVNLIDLMSPEYFACSPNGFVYCISHAQAVCTDSFHASVFSILYKIPFITFERIEGERKMSSRIQTLLGTFGLEDRKYKKNKAMSVQCDFSKCDKILEEKRYEINAFLTEAFS